MRTLLAVLAVLLSAPATAGASFARAAAVPVFDAETPRAVAYAGERGVVVTQAGGEPYGRATMYVSTLPRRRRTTFADTALLDSVTRQDGGVDLLVRRPSELLKRADITLRRVLPSGKIYDLWSVRTNAYQAALARGKDRTFVAWPEGSALKLVTRPDGGIPTHPHNARLGVRSPLDVDLEVDALGRLVAAVQAGSGGLVVASLRSTGSVLRRQLRRNVDGLVQLAVTARGRVGLLVEDTGIEGDGGECVGDGEGRHIRVLVRERDAARFGATQTIESPRFGCGSSGALLRALPADGLAVVYQGGSYDFPPLLARAATAPAGAAFGLPVTLATDARADAAVVTHAGELVTALLRKSTEPEVYSGALSILRTPGAEERIVTGPVSSPLLTRDRDGRAVLAWRGDETIQVAVDRP